MYASMRALAPILLVFWKSVMPYVCWAGHQDTKMVLSLAFRTMVRSQLVGGIELMMCIAGPLTSLILCSLLIAIGMSSNCDVARHTVLMSSLSYEAKGTRSYST